MLHSRDMELDEPSVSSETIDIVDAKLAMADRSSPRWALVLGATFGVSIFLCTLAIILLSFLFHAIVVEAGESRMALVLLGVGFCLVMGVALLEFAHTRSLRGFRWMREQQARLVAAVLAAPISMTILFVHPLAGLSIPICSGVGWLVQRQLSRVKSNEPPWVYFPEEAVSLCAGRDGNGAAKAMATSANHALSDPFRRVVVLMALLISFATGAFLVSEQVLMPGIMLSLALISAWCVNDVLKYAQVHFGQNREDIGKSTRVQKPVENSTLPGTGLIVSHLNVRTQNGNPLLADISLSIDPGEIVGIIGESGAGKSLLMQSLVDPFSLADVQVSGLATQNGTDLWQRSSGIQLVPAVHVADTPLILPASGADNLSCYQGDDQLKRGRYFLEQMVFAHDLVQEICSAPDARLLPSMHRKSLALSRAFALSPSVYFFDRPEDALQAAQVSALCHRLDQEVRLGRSIVLISDNRALLDKCDRLFVLQNGTLVDFGPAKQVRERRASGWHRFIAQRSLEAEQNLEKWIRSHFRRNGDEANRRRVALVASELLAVSCREANLGDDDTVEFLFKNFEGHCSVHMMDGSPPISSGQVHKAQELAEQKPLDSRRNPLAAIMANSLDVAFESHLEGRLIKVKVETYDPRKTEVKPGRVHAQTSS